MLFRRLNKNLKKFYESKFLYIHDTDTVDSRSGLQITLFGSTSNLGPHLAFTLGKSGSDMIYPQREDNFFNEHAQKLYLSSNTG